MAGKMSCIVASGTDKSVLLIDVSLKCPVNRCVIKVSC